MANIRVEMKDGTVQEFKHKGRSGGSYTVERRYEGAFFVVKDEWGKETAIPAADIKQAITEPHDHW